MSIFDTGKDNPREDLLSKRSSRKESFGAVYAIGDDV